MRPMRLYNFRDLGGLRTATNTQEIKPGLLFRTGNVAHWSESAAQHVAVDRGVKLYIDLRNPIEVEKFGAPDNLVKQKVEWMPISIDTSDEIFENTKLPKAKDWLDLYQRLFEKNLKSWVQFTKVVSTANTPVLYGCLFGKDRTGIATSLILNLLDVHDEHIVTDYAKTTSHIGPLADLFQHLFHNHGASTEEIFEHYSRSHESVMLGFLEFIRSHPEDHILGSELKFLSDNYGDALRKRLLQNV